MAGFAGTLALLCLPLALSPATLNTRAPVHGGDVITSCDDIITSSSRHHHIISEKKYKKDLKKDLNTRAPVNGGDTRAAVNGGDTRAAVNGGDVLTSSSHDQRGASTLGATSVWQIKIKK